MVLNALLTIGKLGLVNVAYKFGQPRVKQQTSELEKTARIVGENAAWINLGMMSQMQDDPSSTTTQCHEDTLATNTEFINMSDITRYVADSGEYDSAVFLNLFKVMQIKFITQMESCEYIGFIIAMDGMLSKIPQASAAIVNTVIQLGTGFENRDTSIFIAVNKVQDGIDGVDNACSSSDADAGKCVDVGDGTAGINFKYVGEGIQLGLSQLLKISAGDSKIEVVPTSV